jgi:HNH endonuclease
MHSWLRLPIKGGCTLIELRDLSIFDMFTWHMSDRGYIVNRSTITASGKKETIRLHRVINRTPPGFDTDHKNHNRADNRRTNLVTATRSENLKNASVPRWGLSAINAARTACARGHEYDDNTRVYRGERVCRQCKT